MHKQEFATYIRLARLAKKLNKSEFARRVGIPPQYVTDIESGRAIPSEDKLEKVAGVLDLDAREVFRVANKLPKHIIEQAKREYYGGSNNALHEQKGNSITV